MEATTFISKSNCYSIEDTKIRNNKSINRRKTTWPKEKGTKRNFVEKTLHKNQILSNKTLIFSSLRSIRGTLSLRLGLFSDKTSYICGGN